MDRFPSEWRGASPAPEMQLLLACARREIGAEHRNEIRGLVRSGMDWQRLLSLAAYHKLIPLLWWHLKSEAPEIPEAEGSTLRRLFAWNARRMLQLSGELLEVLRRFDAAGIGAVPHKGPALGVFLYGNLALRQAGDLDLFVRRESVTAAGELMIADGYVPADPPGAVSQSLRYRKDDVEVQLHWLFTDGEALLPIDFESVQPHLWLMSLGGGRVRMLGKEDLLLLLCAEGAKNRWDRLEGLCSVAELLRSHSRELAWDSMIRRAPSLRVQRTLLLGVLLAHELLNAPVPGEMIRLAEADGRAATLAAAVPKLLMSGPLDYSAAAQEADELFRENLREGPVERLRFAWQRATRRIS